MGYQKSGWFDGLLFAEYLSAQGWTFVCVNESKGLAAWKWEDTDGMQTVFGEAEWLDGVRDYYKNMKEII